MKKLFSLVGIYLLLAIVLFATPVVADYLGESSCSDSDDIYESQEYRRGYVIASHEADGTDSGTNLYYYDECMLYSDGNYEEATDCSGSDCYVKEWKCGNYGDYLAADSDYIACPGGCDDGKCFEAESPETEDEIPEDETEETTVVCTDPDGDDIYTKGSATGWNADMTEVVTTPDSCVETLDGPFQDTGNWVAETECDADGRVHINFYECEYGCEDGVCSQRVCSSTDADDSIYVKGTTYGIFLNYLSMPVARSSSDAEASQDEWEELTDLCADENRLVEYGCAITSDLCADETNAEDPICTNSSLVIDMHYECEHGCVDGACLEEAIGDCTDTDGLDYYTWGSATGWNADMTEIVTAEDSCVESPDEPFQADRGNWVAESVCDGDLVRVEFFHCNYGCENGVCLDLGDVSAFEKDIISELLSVGESLTGTELPSALGLIFGNERINIHITLNTGEVVVLGLEIEEKVLQGITEGEIDDPTMNAYASEEAIRKIMDSDDSLGALMDAMDNKEITYRGVGFWSRIKFGIVSFFSKIAGFFMGSSEDEVTPENPTIAVTKVGSGRVISYSPGGINCGEQCSYSYPVDRQVDLTAEPSEGSTFVSWDGCDSISDDVCTVVANADKTVTVIFTSDNPTLTVTKAGSGRVISYSPGGINCGEQCSYSYPVDRQVELTAEPSEGSTFVSWDGCDSISDEVCTVIITNDKTVIATFSS